MEIVQAVFLINNLSRSGRRTAKTIQNFMENKDLPYRIIKVVGNAFNFEEFIEENPKETLYVIAGGDGSLNHYVTYLEERGLDVPIAYLASGSGNDFARSLGIPHNDMTEGLSYIFSRKEPRELSVIKAQGKSETFYAVNSIGFGIDGWVNKKIYESSAVKKRLLGSNIYAASLIPAFFDMEPGHVQIELDGLTYDYQKTVIAAVLNNPYLGGGIKLHPEATALDDNLEIVVLNDLKITSVPQILKDLLTDQSHLDHPSFHTFSAKNIGLNILDEEYGQKDGELIHKDSFSLQIGTVKRLFWV